MDLIQGKCFRDFGCTLGSRFGNVDILQRLEVSGFINIGFQKKPTPCSGGSLGKKTSYSRFCTRVLYSLHLPAL